MHTRDELPREGAEVLKGRETSRVKTAALTRGSQAARIGGTYRQGNRKGRESRWSRLGKMRGKQGRGKNKNRHTVHQNKTK